MDLEKIYQKEYKGIFGFFVKHYRFTYLIILAILFFGIYSMLSLTRASEPEIKVPIAVVTTVYPGATPVDIEELITKPLEKAVSNLDQLNKYESSSSTGVSSIVVEFLAQADLKESYQKLRDAIDAVRLPEDATDPTVTEIRIDDRPIVTYSVIGQDVSVSQLNVLAAHISDEIESISDVSKVERIGDANREFKIQISPLVLQQLNISLSEVVASISSNFINVPIGNIEVDDLSYAVRVEGKYPNVESLYSLVVTSRQGTPIYLSDVADISDTFKEQTTISRIGFPSEISHPTISLAVYKKVDGDILDMVEQADALVAILQSDSSLASQVRIEKTNDLSVFIQQDLSRLGWSGLQTIILIILILFMILGIRESVITSLAVPLAFFIAFTGIFLLGETLNGMVLFSLVLSLGLMVDNAIVIMEGINEYMSKHKFNSTKAALLSVCNYRWPITSGTLTTVAAFAPMLLVSGIMGEFLSVMPKTISLTLLASLFVALVILPTLASRFIKKNGGNTIHKWNYLSQGVEKIKPHYKSFLSHVLPDKKKRRKYILTAWLFFIIALALPISGAMKIEMFPQVDIDFFYVRVSLPNGTVLEKTDEITKQVEQVIAQIPELDNYVTDVGSGGVNNAQITVNLVSADDRDRASYEVTKQLREQLATFSNAEVTVEELNAGPPTGSPIQVRVYGENTDQLSQVSEDIQGILKNIPGVINIEDNLEISTGDITFRVKQEEASQFGLSTIQIASFIRNALFGVQAQELNIGGEEVDVTVALDKSRFNDISDLEQLLMTTPRGILVSLNQVADFTLEPSLQTIHHRDGKNIVAINADLQQGINATQVTQEFLKNADTLAIPSDVTYEVGGEVEEIQKSFTEVFTSMIVAVILIAGILVLQFNSFKQPFIIMFTLPLAMIGVLFGLQLVGVPFGFAVFIGIVALTGIVVNDSIVLIDKVNKNVRSGMSFVEALVDGGTSRIEPILMTSLTTIAGIFPLIYADEFWAGLGLTVIFGLSFSTILTLIIVPLMYMSLVKEKDIQ